MKLLDINELKRMIDGKEDFKLINVLPAHDFLREHIPESDNIPVEEDGFQMIVEQKLGSKYKPVVFYCAGHGCEASLKAAKKLDEAGFKNVYYYAGGIQEWKDFGLPLRGGLGGHK